MTLRTPYNRLSCYQFQNQYAYSMLCNFHVDSIPVLRSELDSPTNTSIILDNVVCSGGERNLSECDYISTGSISCDRSHKAGVRCGGRQCECTLTHFALNSQDDKAFCPLEMSSFLF